MKFFSISAIGENYSSVTECDNGLCGMCCWYPRNLLVAIIEHNCISTKYKGNGFGIEQLTIALMKLQGECFQKVTVSTGIFDLFLPAQKNVHLWGI